MKFSEVFELEGASEEEWFDPILTIDTKLFIDPFLVYDLPTPDFEGSHEEIVAFFNHVMRLIAASKGDKVSRVELG